MWQPVARRIRLGGAVDSDSRPCLINKSEPLSASLQVLLDHAERNAIDRVRIKETGMLAFERDGRHLEGGVASGRRGDQRA